MDKNILSSYWYARPSLIEGIARLVDVGGTLSEYNNIFDSQQADALALYSDWLVVGDDLREAILDYDKLEAQIDAVLTQKDKKLLKIIGK